MGKQASNRIDPFTFASRDVTEKGEIDLADMTRLGESIDPSSSGTVSYEMRFFKEGKASRADGHVATTVNMLCQRCLQPMPVEINSTISIEFVKDEPETSDQDEESAYEWVIIPDEPISLADLIEDEVMMALPFAPMHDEGDCPSTRVVKELQENSRLNPFAVLEGLKSNKQES